MKALSTYMLFAHLKLKNLMATYNSSYGSNVNV